MHDRQPDQGLRFEFDPVEKVLGGDGIRILRLERGSTSSVRPWPFAYVFETALHTRLDTGATERCDLTEMLWNLRTTEAKNDRRCSRRTYDDGVLNEIRKTQPIGDVPAIVRIGHEREYIYTWA